MRNRLPLNALRAFESSARHLNFTRAGLELSVTQAAVSQQVRALEQQLGIQLFRRLPRGLDLTEEGQALLPILNDAFDRIESVLQQFEGGHFHEVLTVAVVGTFAVGWLMPRLAAFKEAHPFIDLRVMTNNNLVNLSADGMDFAIRFGEGRWPATHNRKLFDAPLTVLCPPAVAARLRTPQDLQHELLMRTYRKDEWERWFAAAQVAPWRINGPVFDSSRLMVEGAIQCGGVALAPPCMFGRELREGVLQRPFAAEAHLGSYWLTSLKSRAMTPAMKVFVGWMSRQAEDERRGD
ncbi:HTH-type transcriptional activator AmpR [Serratia entomophila]|jgi:LysR family transcriptional regulator of beta-lactamase|uniref:LysR family transcriptional regulator n=1 Tax=Serratia entomophila TaxID=42906 RepID=A0ABY5CXU8_9GAMM|nr:LysR family transcriptional regulator [Serratia entomophila]UIW20512.1 LysR family transcriptional regulator [Serratia entomophila]USV03014.1 LysR family transcriptional regulator [Serratia entomophila]CAI0728495.1 HTH-type transcriptional activator AmpR [Serratia entomophila]CAI0795011.1 HTH-type transcriptional activator AmpR [Serratia entomophila]CAI0819986.1 HTH-type transcriptional activator AmpR [Serratia entomophila]